MVLALHINVFETYIAYLMLYSYLLNYCLVNYINKNLLEYFKKSPKTTTPDPQI